jgi:hypothetical protein
LPKGAPWAGTAVAAGGSNCDRKRFNCIAHQKMGDYIYGVFFVTMVLSALTVDVAFSALGLAPPPNPDTRAEMVRSARTTRSC